MEYMRIYREELRTEAQFDKKKRALCTSLNFHCNTDSPLLFLASLGATSACNIHLSNGHIVHMMACMLLILKPLQMKVFICLIVIIKKSVLGSKKQCICKSLSQQR